MTLKSITQEKIFAAATQAFEEKGFAGARMQEIAARAGINQALLHYYFRSKEKLFDAVFAALAATMFDKLFGCFSNDLPLERKLQMFYNEHISFLQEHPHLPTFVLNEINQNPQRLAKIFGAERIDLMVQNVFRQLDDEIQSGNIRPVDKTQLFINVIALSMFPFLARGVLEMLFQQNVNFNDVIERRKTELAQFIMNAVKNK
ncbi:TetR/AcrR family transcriptional regulator [candidate division KSB1 bacterium]|nr:TetR/AcrR family transcriptional regulator [candidate division KSB1 bacterium]